VVMMPAVMVAMMMVPVVAPSIVPVPAMIAPAVAMVALPPVTMIAVTVAVVGRRHEPFLGGGRAGGSRRDRRRTGRHAARTEHHETGCRC
jgi:hypothetical protein